MHAAPDVPALYFSEGKNAFQALAGAILCIAGVAMIFLLPMAIDPAASPRRRAWLEFMNQGNGWVGTILFLVPALVFGWWAARAIWRSDATSPAARLIDGQIVLHRSFLRAKPIPLAALRAVEVVKETPRIRALALCWSDAGGTARTVKIRSNIVRDDLSLEFFAAALNAARNSR